MPVTFYPQPEEAQRGSLSDRVELLMDAASRYKAFVLDIKPDHDAASRMAPCDQPAAFNWQEIAHVLRQIRELPEGAKVDKQEKAEMLVKLAEVYEVLRGARMSKLEAVRLALISEAEQLRGDLAQGT